MKKWNSWIRFQFIALNKNTLKKNIGLIFLTILGQKGVWYSDKLLLKVLFLLHKIFNDKEGLWVRNMQSKPYFLLFLAYFQSNVRVLASVDHIFGPIFWPRTFCMSWYIYPKKYWLRMMYMSASIAFFLFFAHFWMVLVL